MHGCVLCDRYIGSKTTGWDRTGVCVCTCVLGRGERGKKEERVSQSDSLSLLLTYRLSHTCMCMYIPTYIHVAQSRWDYPSYVPIISVLCVSGLWSDGQTHPTPNCLHTLISLSPHTHTHNTHRRDPVAFLSTWIHLLTLFVAHMGRSHTKLVQVWVERNPCSMAGLAALCSKAFDGCTLQWACGLSQITYSALSDRISSQENIVIPA